jgi:hypothetical protein
MSYRTRGILLLLIQIGLVCTVAGKYLYERATRPRVWVRVAQNDPNLPMRGRYLALSPRVDSCRLPKDKDSDRSWDNQEDGRSVRFSHYEWRVTTFAENGKLAVRDARDVLPHTDTQSISLVNKTPCECALLRPGFLFFIPDTAKSPFPLAKGQELWAEVSVPPAGPPRPIQLALREDGKWEPLKFE